MSYLEIARRALERAASGDERNERNEKRCCPLCDERHRRPDPLGDGCGLHGQSAEDVRARWQKVGPQHDPAVCLCCAGPTADSRGFVCARCSGEESSNPSGLRR